MKPNAKPSARTVIDEIAWAIVDRHGHWLYESLRPTRCIANMEAGRLRVATKQPYKVIRVRITTEAW
jgi:hypothetical protein